MDAVVVGLSGGVDSAVAAHTLKEQGYRVVGVFMNQLGNATELASARTVAEQLGIEFAVVDYQTVFREQVIDRYHRERVGDFTPNPCCWCNPTVKFKCLLDFADAHGITLVATGHYAQIHDGLLFRGVDEKKDQSYFLAGLAPAQLKRIIFPLGGLTKPQVRERAKSLGLTVHNKPDSNDLCFHVATAGLTIGQGVKRGGQPQKLYYLGNGQIGTADDPALFRTEVAVKNFNWLAPISRRIITTAKVRYRQVDQPCTVTTAADGKVTVIFHQPVRAVTPGQWCVVYAGDQVIGGGEIK